MAFMYVARCKINTDESNSSAVESKLQEHSVQREGYRTSHIAWPQVFWCPGSGGVYFA